MGNKNSLKKLFDEADEIIENKKCYKYDGSCESYISELNNIIIDILNKIQHFDPEIKTDYEEEYNKYILFKGDYRIVNDNIYSGIDNFFKFQKDFIFDIKGYLIDLNQFTEYNFGKRSKRKNKRSKRKNKRSKRKNKRSKRKNKRSRI